MGHRADWRGLGCDATEPFGARPGLSVASLINGPVLGVFLVGTFSATSERAARVDRNAGEHCGDDLCAFLDADSVDLVRADRQRHYFFRGVDRLFCFRARAEGASRRAFAKLTATRRVARK